jgi:hypothetical protein
MMDIPTLIGIAVPSWAMFALTVFVPGKMNAHDEAAALVTLWLGAFSLVTIAARVLA